MNIPHNDAEYRRAPAGIKARKLKKGFSSYEVLSNCLSAGEPYIAYGVTPYIGRVPLSTKCSQMTFHGRFRQACFSHDFAPSRSSFCLNPKGSYELSNSLLVGQPLHFCAYASFAWFLNDLVHSRFRDLPSVVRLSYRLCGPWWRVLCVHYSWLFLEH